MIYCLHQLPWWEYILERKDQAVEILELVEFDGGYYWKIQSFAGPSIKVLQRVNPRKFAGLPVLKKLQRVPQVYPNYLPTYEINIYYYFDKKEYEKSLKNIQQPQKETL